MGTDIRLYPEQRVDGHWQFAGKMIKNIHYVYDPEHEPYSLPQDLYDIRNYALFAILADVRNDEGYECIAPRRGIPDDLSPEIKRWFEHYQESSRDMTALPQDERQRASWIAQDIDLQLHPGWLTLEEMVNFPWHEKRIQIYASVDPRVAHLFHPEQRFPFQQWPAGIPCSYSTTSKEDRFCNASWTETYAEAAGEDFMELLNTFAQHYGPSKEVRFVFWFSS